MKRYYSANRNERHSLANLAPKPLSNVLMYAKYTALFETDFDATPDQVRGRLLAQI